MVETISTYQELRSFTKNEKVLEELKNYTRNSFISQNTPFKYQLLNDEPLVTDWEKYVEESTNAGVFQTLKKYLVQFWFPIEKGISQTNDYKKATLKGFSKYLIASATGLILNKPNQLKLFLHQSLVGRIPVLIVEDREDFVSIVRALTYRNEPQFIPESLELQSKEVVLKNKDLFQDRIIVLSKIPYSNVSAEMMKLDKEQWLDASLKIRLEHECAHYFTLRHFGKMSANMHDEIIADYNGISAVLPHYKSDWFLKFVGLEDYPSFRETGRLQNYKGKPALSDEAFYILQRMIKQASDNLEFFDAKINISHSSRNQLARLFTLCFVDLVKMSSESGVEILYDKYKELNSVIQMNEK